MRSLSDYLNIEDTVRLVKDFTKVPFFNEGNLFDLVVKEELKPIVYFDGYGSILLDKNKSPYPEDFEGDEELTIDDIWEGRRYYKQLNYVKGYFYLLHSEKFLTSTTPIEHGQFEIQNLVDYQVLADSSLPNSGRNSKGGVFKKTIPYANDFISLSTYEEKTPSFSKLDIKFYILDVINMLERNGYYSADDKQPDTPADDKDLNPKDSAYHLIAVLKDLLLNPDINAYHFKTDNSKSTNQPTQTGLAEYIDAMDIRGLKARNINGIFSKANRLLNDTKNH